jgi:hypothetical protein
MSTTYTLKFDLTPKHKNTNFLMSENKVVWDLMPEGCVYTTQICFDTGTITYEVYSNELSKQDIDTLTAKIQELVIEFA